MMTNNDYSTVQIGDTVRTPGSNIAAKVRTLYYDARGVESAIIDRGNGYEAWDVADLTIVSKASDAK